MSIEETVWIDGPNGALFAIAHKPENPVKLSACLIMINAGRLNRVGPQRLYVSTARMLVERGMWVLRVDLSGIGDSQSQSSEVHFDEHRPEEVAAVIRYAKDVLNCDKIFLQGLCAGARVALKEGGRNPLVDGILAWSCPIISSSESTPSSPYENQNKMSDYRAQENVRFISGAISGKKIISLRWWFRRIYNLPNELRRLVSTLKHLCFPETLASNPFLDGADRYINANRDILFIYGACDTLPLGEFKDRYSSLPESETLEQGYCVIPHGTHTFNSLATQAALLDHSIAWLDKRLGQSLVSVLIVE